MTLLNQAQQLRMGGDYGNHFAKRAKVFLRWVQRLQPTQHELIP
jgi:hypothetical protein